MRSDRPEVEDVEGQNDRSPTREVRQPDVILERVPQHEVRWNWIADLPFGKGKPMLGSAGGVLNQIVGGWSVNGIFTGMSGEPFSVRSGVRTSNFSHESRAAHVGGLPEVKLQEIAAVTGPVLFKLAGST